LPQRWRGQGRAPRSPTGGASFARRSAPPDADDRGSPACPPPIDGIPQSRGIILEDMKKVTQSSAVISVKPHHLQTLEEPPLDAVVHARLVVTRESGREVLARISSPKPTKALKELMARRRN